MCLFLWRKMETVRCQNRFTNAKNGICGRILGVLTDLEIDMLRIDKEGGPIFRCPQCPPEQRWSQVSMDKEGHIKFTTLDEIKVPNDLKFDDFEICEQVG
jgi:hypothetical protein